MILDEVVEIIIGSHHIKYYKELGYQSEFGKKIIVKIKDLPKGSNVKIRVKCDIEECNVKKQLQYNMYIKNTKNLTLPYCCCEKCAQIKNRKTKLERYGNENYNNIDKNTETCFKNNGVKHPLQNEKIKEKTKETNRIKYGGNSPSCNKEIKEKQEQTCKNNYGVEYPQQNEEVRNKTIKTNIEKYGVENPMQYPDIWKKQQKSSCDVFKYKDTNLTWQGKSELCFLEFMDKYGFINEVLSGKLYDYTLINKHHVYYSDYLFRGITIEIKSTWTYNKNGTDLELELENETKWKAVRDFGDKLIILWSKKEIKEYVKNLIK